MKLREDAIALAVAIACALLLLSPAILGSDTVFARDIEVFEASRDRFVAESFRSGEGIPRWAPGILGGAPCLASQEMGLLYPPTLALALVATDRAEAIGIALHLVLAALGARALARSLGITPAGALTSGVGYAFSGTLVSAHLAPVYVRSGAWLPWAIAGIFQASRGERRGLLLAVLALSGIYLSGDPQGALVAALAALAVVAAASGETRASGRGAAALALAGVLAALVCAAQLFPALSAFGETARRQGLTLEQATRWSLWPPELFGLVAPLLYGTEALPGSEWFFAVSPSHERPWSESLYAGAVVLALAAAALPRARADGRVRAGLALVLLFLPFALGAYAPLYAILHALPGGSLFRYPAKLFVPCALGIALLAGAGASLLVSGETNGKSRRVAVFALAALAALSFVGLNVAAVFPESLGGRMSAPDSSFDGARAISFLAPRFAHTAVFSLGALSLLLKGKRRERVVWALAALAALDLSLAARHGIALAPRAPFVRAPKVAETLAQQATQDGEPARVLAHVSAQRPTPDEEASISSVALSYVAEREGLVPNSGLGHGVLSQGGFLSNAPWRVAKLDERPIPPLRLAILQGARYVLASPPETALYTDRPPPFRRNLIKIRGAPRWASLVTRARFVRDADSALDAIADPAFDPRKEAVLETAPLPLTPSEGPASAKLDGKLGLHAFAVSLEAPGSAWLVVREAYAPGWTASVDDGPWSPVVPADLVFRAVRVEKGARRVAFRYETPGLAAGGWVSALTLLALGGIGAYTQRKHGT